MKNFKTFSQEARAEGSAELKFVNIFKIREFLENNCKDSLWMIKQNAPLYRGFRKLDDSHPTYVDLRGTQRASENTSNWYTEIFDNHPEMKDFPKRSKSLICTTDYDYARQFGKPSVVIPVDGAKIGLAGTEDIWDLRMDLFGRTSGESIKDANNTLQKIVLACQNDGRTKDASFEQLEQIDAILKTPNNEIIDGLSDDPYQFGLNFEKFINNSDFTDNFYNRFGMHIRRLNLVLLQQLLKTLNLRVTKKFGSIRAQWLLEQKNGKNCEMDWLNFIKGN